MVEKEVELKKFTSRQREIYENKLRHGFNTTDLDIELNCIKGEVVELEQGMLNNDKENIMEELADIVIFSYGLAEILGESLDEQIFKKMEINKNRVYKKNLDGTFTKVIR